ncbi:MAG TPA: polysaccharide deacetylase family protein [Opitutaceae bacterium]|jgi:peptidoglycan/xylan/chitin deacetylase (PgdA/CDA1 family)
MKPFFVICNLLGKVAALWVWRHSHWGAAACFLGFDLILLYGMLAPGSQLLCSMVTAFEPRAGQPTVWLTIDDGPDPGDTRRILDLLDRRGARATFFCVGRRAEESPELLGEIRRRGHQIGHHTQTHPKATFWLAGPGRVQRELDQATAVFAAHGPAPELFRPPVGIKNLFLRRALADRGLTCVSWTIRSRDCFTYDPRVAVDRVLRQLRPGAIILAHEGPSVPPAVRVRFLELLLAALSERGYACVIPGSEQWRPRFESAAPGAAAIGGRRRRSA